MAIRKDDYIEGKEHYGHSKKIVRGWVDSISNDGEHFFYNIQADDDWHGSRGTVIVSYLGEVRKLEPKVRLRTQ